MVTTLSLKSPSLLMLFVMHVGKISFNFPDVLNHVHSKHYLFWNRTHQKFCKEFETNK